MIRMNRTNDNVFVFDSDSHEYRVNGNVLTSVTQAMEKVGLRKHLPDSDFIRARAEFGTLVHKEIEEFELFNKKPLTAEARFWARYGHPLADEWHVEVMFFTLWYAGTCDAIGIVKDKDGNVVKYILVDHKTGVVEIETVSWQMSLYYNGLVNAGLIDGSIPVELLCYDAKGDDGCFIEVPLKSKDEIDRFIQALNEGKEYEEPSALLNMGASLEKDSLSELFRALSEIPADDLYALCKTVIDKRIDELEKAIKAKMLETNMSKVTTSNGYSWKLSTYESSRFSQEEAEKRYPKLWPMIKKKCTKTTQSSKLTFQGRKTREEKNNANA